MPMDRRQFIARAGAAGAVAAAGVAGLDGVAAAAAPSPYPGAPHPYHDGTLAQQAAATAADNAAIGAYLRSLGIQHVVVAMMENRSFDHLLSWLPGADGRRDMAYPAPDGEVYPNYPLGGASPNPDFQGCGYNDPDHSWEGWLAEDADGALDGFLRSPSSGDAAGFRKVAAGANTFPIGYYDADDIPAFAALARTYTVCDRYFCSFAGETYPNRFYQHSGATDRDHNSGGPSTATIPAIWDQLTPAPGTVGTVAGKVTGAYYFKDAPFLALWGSKYLPFCRPFEAPQTASQVTNPLIDGSKIPAALVESALNPSLASGLGALSGVAFLDAVKTGALPNVSYIDPSFVVESSGTSGDWHPMGDVRVGDAFIADIYHALADFGPNGPAVPGSAANPSYLDSTLLIINFDEWGGFYDHVQPPKVTDLTVRNDPTKPSHTGNTTTEGLSVPDYTQLGFRGPTIVVSNLVPAQVVSTVFDHTSVLALIESIFELTPVVPYGSTPPAGAVGPATRDNFANNIGAVVPGSPAQPFAKRSVPASAVPTSVQLAALGHPVSGEQTPCSATKVKSTPPAPIGTTSSWTKGYGPATQPGAVSPTPPSNLPEVPVAVAAPLAAAALAGYAIKKRSGSSAAEVPEA